MQTISRHEVQDKQQQGAVVVEVLDAEKYESFHLPGAINVPLDDDFGHKIQSAVPEKSRPVVVYCYDLNCEASAKAAAELETLGYSEIYDYEEGKVDWKEAGLPVE